LASLAGAYGNAADSAHKTDMAINL